MLNRITLESARILAEELERRRIVVSPNPDTPLQELVEVGMPINGNGDEAQLPTTLESSVESLEINTQLVEDTTAASHDTLSDNLSSNIADLMNRRLDLARNVINPLVRKYEDIIVRALVDCVPETPEVKELDFGDFYDHPIAKELFNGWGNQGVDKLNGMVGIVFNKDNDFHKAALNTGHDFLDRKLQSILEERGNDWYLDVANRYFNQGEELGLIKPELTEDYLEASDRNLLTHVLARYFYNRQESLNNQPVTEYDLHLLKVLGRTAKNANGLLTYKANLERNDEIVPEIASESNTIIVYGPNYRSYLERGGNNTALMGYSRTNKVLNGAQIIAASASLESIYDREVDGEIRRLRSEKLQLIKREAYRHLPEIIDEIPDTVVVAIPELTNTPGLTARQVLLQRGNDFIDTPSAIDDSNIYQYAQNIICIGLLPELEVHLLFAKIEKYLAPAEGVSSLTPAQAVYYAVLEEIVQFFLSQTSLSDASH